MDTQTTRTTSASRTLPPLATLIVSAVLLVCVFAVLSAISLRFQPGSEPAERPVLAMLGLIGVAFIAYLIALRAALKVREGRPLMAVILLSSVLIRGVSLFSWPILEVDIYRYIWDGAAVLQGVSPYDYSPQQVRVAGTEWLLPEAMRRLVDLRDGSTSLETILNRIHYGELTTIYPPVSQAVFASAVLVTPGDAGVFEYVLAMKSVLVLFDVATLVVILGLLRLTRKHMGWSVAYGWCPLVIKEIANAGHLDSVAVFLSTLALYFAVKPLGNARQGRTVQAQTVAAAMLLALAVGAKLYPIVLAPMLVVLWSRVTSWRWASFVAVLFVAATTVVLWPLLPANDNGYPPDARHAVADGTEPLPPDAAADVVRQTPSGGLQAFLKRWEMNDFLFMLVVENLKPSAGVEPARQPWFAVTPESWKAGLISNSSRWIPFDENEVAFALARLVTGIVFLLIGASLLWRASSSSDAATWLRVAFLTLAWFWLLSPTQNPWYWTWALPLVMFARSRAWLAMSGLAMMYYLRFWFVYQWPDQPVLNTSYAGAAFFDFVVTWIEFGPWLVLLAWRFRPLCQSREGKKTGLFQVPV
ncbi:MAG: hypothetical protein ACC628_05385 [Pirellulaceae bacterium]